MIANIVETCVRKHTGGEEFFTALDLRLKDRTILCSLLDEVLKFQYPEVESMGLVVSGKFGQFVSDNSPTGNILHVSGGLREDKPLEIIRHLEDTECKHFIFLDDSFYSGKTRDTIKEYLESNGNTLLETFVVYDGSKEKDENVHSLYRYYK